MLIARPGQLHSVSWLAADSSVSVLARQAAGMVLNRGLAEEIFLMQPDLIIAGTYTTRATVTLLRRLGFKIEEFSPAATIDDIRTNILRMGTILGNTAKSKAMVEQLDKDLAKLASMPQHPQTLALYYANSYTSGTGTLADAVVDLSGLRNLGKELGYAGTVRLPLEVLISSQPDFVAGRERDFGGPAKAQENFQHPAYLSISAGRRGIAIESKYWVCGTPFTLQAAHRLAAHATEVSDHD